MILIYGALFTGLWLPALLIKRKASLIERAVSGWEEIFRKLSAKLPRVRAPTYALRKKQKKYRREKAMKELYPLSHPEEKAEGFEREKHRYVFLVCLGACLLALLSALDALGDNEPEGGLIRRNPPGGTEKSLVLDAEGEGGEVYREMGVEVKARQYTEAELSEKYERLLPVLEKTALNGNPDVDHVYENLYLPDMISGYPFSLKWQSGDYELLEDTGRLVKEEFPPEGEALSLTVFISCQDFEREYVFPLVLRSKAVSPEEERYKSLLGEVEEALEKDPEKEEALLPESFRGESLSWKKTDRDQGLLILCLGLLLALLTAAARENRLTERVKERDRSLLYAYPDFVNRLNLYLGAGLSISSCLYRIGAEGKEKEDYLNQELRYTLNELSGGISEKDALEGLGRRIRLPCYIKLTTLLVQNLRKGGGQLLPRLKEEAENAFIMRKNLAREAGERAGTRLIFPMLLMMGVVMVVIIVPAFIGFQGE